MDSNKNIFNDRVFSYNDFTQTTFISYIMENYRLNSVNTILVQLNFHKNNLFLMSGPQIGLKITDHHNISYYKNVYNIIISRIDDIISKYDIDSLPETILIKQKNLNLSKSLELTTIKDIEINIKNINKSVLKKIFSSKYLPLSKDISKFGYLVEGELKSNYINRLLNNIKNKTIQSQDLESVGSFNLVNSIVMNLNKLQKFNFFRKSIWIKKSNLDVVIIDCSINELIYNNIIGKNFLSSILMKNNIKGITNLDTINIRLVLDINSGISLCTAIDFIVNDDLFIRNIDNYSLTIFKDKVINISRSLELNKIKAPKFSLNPMSNPKIGVLDVETFSNSQGLGQVYSIGYTTLTNPEKINTYYLSDFGPSLNSDLLILTCINSMLESNYNNYYWYIHNMGKFDMVYIYKTLEEYNLNSKKEKFKLKSTYRNGKMLKLIISKQLPYKSKEIKITFLDSYNILQNSLDSLTKEFKVDHEKGVFPYSFVTEKTLNYIGETPDIKFYRNISVSEYNKIYNSKHWSLKEESLKYLKNDLLGLLEVLDKFKKDLFIEHNVDMTEGLTISRLALNKYLKYYLKSSNIPLINKLNQFNFIYSGYFGGRTEVFKPYGKSLFYYDVNSLYPKVALNKMPGLKCSYKKSFTENGLNLDNLFGVFRAKVKINNNYLGLLPVKTKLGLTFPIGEFEGVWPTPELKLAKDNGNEIKIIEGYDFEKVPSYFKDYNLELFESKKNSVGTKKLVHKSLLNNLLGRFGLNIIKPLTKIVNNNNLDYLFSTRKILSIKEITKNANLVCYNPIIDPDICSSHGIDYIKALSDNSNINIEKSIELFQDVSIIISALVTSYARVFMFKIMNEILKVGGQIYYTDTDSIITDIRLDPSLVGNELGQFKLEYEIKEGYFISNKTYCLVLKDGSTVIKCKGIRNDSLSLNDFQSMYYESKNIYATKTTAITNLSKGSVIIEDKKILLQHDVYLKRNKVYNKEGLWIDTKPLLYNNVEKNIVPIKK